MRHVVAMLATLALILAMVPATVSAAPPQRDTWIVQLKAGVNPAAAAPGLAREHGGSVGYVYRHALKGFSSADRQPRRPRSPTTRRSRSSRPMPR